MGELAEESWQREAFGNNKMTTIEDGVPPPTEGKKPASKRPGAKRARAAVKAKESPAAGFIAALNFIALAQAKEGTAYQTHSRIEHGWLMAFNGTIALGTKVQEDLTACPRTLDLLHALTKCGTNLSITQLNEATLRIASGEFRATIDCLPQDQVAYSYPDEASVTVGPAIKEAFEALAWVVKEGAPRAFSAGVLLQSGSAVATDGFVMLEYWHGFELPGSVLVPKACMTALCKIDKRLVSIGCTANQSITFWFEDGSFLKSQLFNEQYPNYRPIFDRAEGVPVTTMPADFWKALEAVAPFSKDKFVRFRENILCSTADVERGATYNLPGLPNPMQFNHEFLTGVKAWFENVRFPSLTVVNFSKGPVRGAVMGGAN